MIFIGALYFFNMYCFILSSILFLFLFPPRVSPLINKWLVYLFLEHSISFQASLRTAENCSPLTCGGSRTTGFPPRWAAFAVMVSGLPRKEMNAALPPRRAGSRLPTAAVNRAEHRPNRFRASPLPLQLKQCPTRQKQLLILSVTLLLPLRILSHPTLSSFSISRELSPTTCVSLEPTRFYLPFETASVGEQGWESNPEWEGLRVIASGLSPGSESLSLAALPALGLRGFSTHFIS